MDTRDNSKLPILVTGGHRSGTSWVGRTLACAEDVEFIWEPFSLSYQPPLMLPVPPCWFYSVTSALEAETKVGLANVLSYKYEVLPRLKGLRSFRQIGRLIRDKRAFDAARKRQPRPLLKDPIALFSAPWIQDTFKARVVVTIRHPAAFCESLIRGNTLHDFSHFLSQKELMETSLERYAGDISRAVRGALDVVDQSILLWNIIYAFVRAQKELGRPWLFVCHEDLVKSPRDKFKELYSDLDLIWGAEVELHLNRGRKVNIHKWRKRLSSETINRIRQGTSELAEYYYGKGAW